MIESIRIACVSMILDAIFYVKQFDIAFRFKLSSDEPALAGAAARKRGGFG
jgi:hypothetical protein